MPITRAEFDAVYDAEILNRRFVEDIEYYHAARKRFWESIQRIDAMQLPKGARMMDIGGGITAILCARLLGHVAVVGDVNERTREDVEALGMEFVLVDVFRDGKPPIENLDLVVFQEVIEHIPQPPYIVLRRLSAMLKPGGKLYLTTPNGHRFRNLLYMIAGREILGIYRYPKEGEAIGHQHEYTMKQMVWQAKEADFQVDKAEYYADGWVGTSMSSKIAWMLAKPVDIIPYMRNAIAMSLQKPV